MPRFNWNDLRYFLETARAGTLSGAARALGTDHATVSRRVALLEQALGLRLFHRSPLGYMLTPDGESLLAHAEAMETHALAAAENSTGAAAALSGTVRLSVPDGFGNFHFARHMGAFCDRFPRLRLQLVTVQQILSLSQREGDVIVSLSPPERGRFVTEKLCSYGLGLYAAPAWLARRGMPASRADLKDHRLIGYVDDLIFARELDYLGDLQPALRAQIQSSSLYAQLTAARNGDGLCILPHYIARQHGDLAPVLAGQFSLTRSYWMSAQADVADLPRVRSVLGFLREVVTVDPPAA